MITQKQIDEQIKQVNQLVGELKGKQSELKNAINALNFDGLKGIKKAMSKIDINKPETIMEAHKIMGEEMEKLFKK